jgi:hypothetical protein
VATDAECLSLFLGNEQRSQSYLNSKSRLRLPSPIELFLRR